MTNNSVGLLGPRNTFSDLATHQHYSDQKDFPQLLYLGTISEVFDAVEKEVVEKGIVPVENTIGGKVEETTKYLEGDKFKIVEHFDFKISHALVTLPNAKKDEITAIISHEQALKQCSNYIEKNFPHVQLIASPSTMAGVQSMKEQEAKNAAAIIPLETVSSTDLLLIEEDIANSENNTTQFAVIQKA